MKLSTLKTLALGSSLSILATQALANDPSSDSLVIESYNVSSDHCLGCGPVKLENAADIQSYLSDSREELLQRILDRASENPAYEDFVSRFIDSSGTQVVFLNFENPGLPFFPVCARDNAGNNLGLFNIYNDHVFTQEERDAIQSRIDTDYADYNFVFTQEEPTAGEYTTIDFADNDAPLDCSQGSNISLVFPQGAISVLFGRADEIDFGNRNKQSGAFTDVSVWEFLAQLGGGVNFEPFSGLDVAGDFGGDLSAAVSFAITGQAANTGAHELGHTLGLRHQNSFGAPGDGLPSTGAVSPFDFVPVFDGPSNAEETILHTMASGASVGLPFNGGVALDRFFSERSATRLAVNEAIDRLTVSESNRRGRPDTRVSLRTLRVPNTIVTGENENARLQVKAAVAEGTLSAEGESDSYIIRARKGDFINAELIPVTATGQTFEEGILGQLRVYQINRNGSEELIASNLRSFESLFDTEVFDVEVPANGDYRIEVTAPDEFYDVDLDGDGVLDPFTLTEGEAPELQVGDYSVLLFTSNVRMRNGPSPVAQARGSANSDRFARSRR